MERRFIKLPLPILVSVLESYGIEFEPGSRVGTATKDTVMYISDHAFIISKGCTVELAS